MKWLGYYFGIAVLGLVIIIGTSIGESVKGYQFENNCGIHLARAATAGSLEIAKSELDIGIKYLEDNKLTSGNTDILLKRTAYDIGYWYENIKAGRKDLDGLDGTALEKSNALIRLKETLTHKDGTLKAPNGVAIYNNIVLFTILENVGGILFFGGALSIFLYIFLSILFNW